MRVCIYITYIISSQMKNVCSLPICNCKHIGEVKRVWVDYVLLVSRRPKTWIIQFFFHVNRFIIKIKTIAKINNNVCKESENFRFVNFIYKLHKEMSFVDEKMEFITLHLLASCKRTLCLCTCSTKDELIERILYMHKWACDENPQLL